MDLPSARSFGNLTLALSLLTFGIFFVNVLIGGPLGHKPWMSDVMEMVTLFVAVIFFVAGALAREAQATPASADGPSGGAKAKEG
jgi:formate hydrogenlyase subunit 4